ILEIANYGVHSLIVGDRDIPVDETGSLLINYYGKGGTFKRYSASDVLSGRVGINEIKDKVVFVGATETGIYDMRATPVDAIFPGVEIHATVAADILQNRYLIKDNRVVAFDTAVIILLPIFLMAAIGSVNRTFISLSIFFVFSFIHLFTNYYLFLKYNVVSSLIYPAFSLGFAYLLAEGYRNIVIEGRNRYIRKAFGTYVSPSLVSQIMKDPDRLKLGGEKREISIFFSDIRGFTSLSEKLTPEELVKVLNEYLSPMTKIVLEEKGTLDKYIGDAIMVVFNAPLDIPDHALRVCRMSLKMMEKLEELNINWVEKGYAKLDIGIGINTGDAVVGNMGAELRFDYTAIGDNVNLASRLEGMNKVYGTHIIVTQPTYEKVKDNFIFRELDAVAVKGKKIPVKIYELMDYNPPQSPFSKGGSGAGGLEKGVKGSSEELAKEFNAALLSYKERIFEKAKERFIAMLKKHPDDGPIKLYIQRCEEYIKNPPPPDWDGAYVAKTK
ncbi:MAG: adenylate/guanylate cyclase domain-containing protein, partial [Deltaproteobacteria bacterium]|nr:adenylate/guanylate cyclase domain-containing protein [Deltaproteobacteria bacterium]